MHGLEAVFVYACFVAVMIVGGIARHVLGSWRKGDKNPIIGGVRSWITKVRTGS